MNIQHVQKLVYHFKNRYLTMENIVIGVALLIAAGWAWGSISMMQRNYTLQRDVDAQNRDAQLAELEVANLQYQQNYYKSDEYKDLAAREHLGLASPGEKVLILPRNSAAAMKDSTIVTTSAPIVDEPSNLEQWMSFLFGGNAGTVSGLQS